MLTRCVRFAVPDDDFDAALARPAVNGYAGHPPMRGLGRHYEIAVTCRGEADPVTGYSLNIKAIDEAVRRGAAPVVARACRARPHSEPGELMPEIVAAVSRALPAEVASLTWRLTPHYSVSIEKSMNNVVILRQQFEFAAAHRLHAPSLSDEENRAIFGKCNNPSGHGHNYRIEPAVAVALNGEGRQTFTLADLESVTSEVIVRRFDHKHLNIDVPEFKTLNPSVENIAKVAFDLLKPAIESAGKGVQLRHVTVWETEKTSCVYPA